MNPTQTQSHREFASEVHQCTDLMRSIRFFQSQLESQKITPDDVDPNIQYSVPELEAQFEELERDLKQLNDSSTQILTTKIQLLEMQYTIETGQSFLNTATLDPNVSFVSDENQSSSSSSQIRTPLSMRYIIGVISQSSMETFHKMIYIALRGNFYINSQNIPDPLIDPVTVCNSIFFLFSLYLFRNNCSKSPN